MKRIEAIKNHPVPIADLGITVYPGNAEWVSDDKALNSDCLTALARAGHLRVSSGEISKVSTKPPTVHSVAMSRPSSVQRTATPTQNNQIDALAEMLRGVIADATRPSVESTSKQDLEKMIERAVAKALANVVVAPSITLGNPIELTVGPEEPVYIPSGIVEAGTVEMQTTSGTSDNSGIDEATQSLKALKTPRKQKKNGEN